MEDVLEELLNAFLDKVADVAPSVLGARVHGVPVRDLERDIMLCVPQLWNPIAKKTFLDAARSTGASTVRLVPESFSAAVFISADKARYGPISPNTCIITADIGGGTADYSTFQVQDASFEHDPQADLFRTRLKLIGEPESGLCGSHYFNQRYLRFLALDSEGSVRKELEKDAASLGLTVSQYSAAADRKFDKFKDDIPSNLHRQDFNDRNIVIGAIPSSSGKGSKVLDISYKQLRDVLEKPIRQNIRLMKKQLAAVLNGVKKILQIPGGMGACQYFVNRVKEELEGSGVVIVGRTQQQELASVHGACLRYNETVIDQLPQEVQFGVKWDEPYEDKVHADAVANPRLVVTSRAGTTGKRAKKEDYVEDRLMWLLKQGNDLSHGTVHYSPIIQRRYIDIDASGPESGLLEETIYCTEHAIADHEPLWIRDRDGEDRMRPEVCPWMTMTLPVDVHRRKFRRVNNVDGAPAYEIWSQIVMRAQGGDVQFGWRLGTSASGLRKGSGDVIWAECEKAEVTNPNFNPFVMPNVI